MSHSSQCSAGRRRAVGPVHERETRLLRPQSVLDSRGLRWVSDRFGLAGGIDDGAPSFQARSYLAHNRCATATSVRATATVSVMLTHSSTAWAPSPLGPNMTVGIPAAAMNAASAQ